MKSDNVLQKVWESKEIVKHDKPFGLKAEIFIPSWLNMKTLEEPYLCIVFYIWQSASPINHLNSPSSQVGDVISRQCGIGQIIWFLEIFVYRC